MKEHALLFNCPMALATLNGSKTQTRRIITAHNSCIDGQGISNKRWQEMAFDMTKARLDNGPSPAGNAGPYLKAPSASEGTTHRLYPRIQVGDLIWGRETTKEDVAGSESLAVYAADDAPVYQLSRWANWDYSRPVRPSIHMPRWAARILLEVVSIRAERLRDISQHDARKEGLFIEDYDWRSSEYYLPHIAYRSHPHAKYRYSDPRQAFAELWDTINGELPWETNPWVWVIEFKRTSEATP